MEKGKWIWDSKTETLILVPQSETKIIEKNEPVLYTGLYL